MRIRHLCGLLLLATPAYAQSLVPPPAPPGVEVQAECRGGVPAVRVVVGERHGRHHRAVRERDRAAMDMALRRRPSGGLPLLPDRGHVVGAERRLAPLHPGEDGLPGG